MKTRKERLEKLFKDNGIQVIETTAKLSNGARIPCEFRGLFKDKEIENRFELDEIGLISMDENGHCEYDEEYIKTVQETENNKIKNIFLNQEDLNNLNKEELEMILSLLKYGRKFNIFTHIDK